MDKDQIMKTGTTTVALICKDGLVLAADKRATAGNMIMGGKIEKVYKITNNLALTIAGSVSDIQLLVKLIKAQINLDKMKRGKELKVKEAANLLASLVYSNIRRMSMIPGIAHFLFAGRDDVGYSLWDIFPDGSLTQYTDYVCSGSGSVFAYGVLEAKYKHNISVIDGKNLVVEAINAALRRDSASGNGVDVYTITRDGVKKVLTKELDYKL
jgi:proteasome beta subunit